MSPPSLSYGPVNVSSPSTNLATSIVSRAPDPMSILDAEIATSLQDVSLILGINNLTPSLPLSNLVHPVGNWVRTDCNLTFGVAPNVVLDGGIESDLFGMFATCSGDRNNVGIFDLNDAHIDDNVARKRAISTLNSPVPVSIFPEATAVNSSDIQTDMRSGGVVSEAPCAVVSNKVGNCIFNQFVPCDNLRQCSALPEPLPVVLNGDVISSLDGNVVHAAARLISGEAVLADSRLCFVLRFQSLVTSVLLHLLILILMIFHVLMSM